jgi:hypothetical protein
MEIPVRITEETAKYYQSLDKLQQAQTLLNCVELGRYSARQVAITPLKNIGVPEEQKILPNGLTQSQSESFRKSIGAIFDPDDYQFTASFMLDIDSDLYATLEDSLVTLGMNPASVQSYFVTYFYHTLTIQAAFGKVFQTNDLINMIEVSNKNSKWILPLIKYVGVPFTRLVVATRKFVEKVKGKR